MMTKQHESSQRPSLIFILWMLGNTDSCCDTVTKVQSYEGYSESVSCPYESRYHNSLKYICRGNRPSTCLQQALITSDTKQNGRFRLDDDKMSGTFTVTINSLTQNDSGSYLCGVQRNSDVDVFSAVELEWCCVKSTTINGTAGYPLTLQCPYPRQYRHNKLLTTSPTRYLSDEHLSEICFGVCFVLLYVRIC
uniref:Ig-like domain-containing protein n=1 Tax=Astatotilapia calliptera TaxID=8154 RepID=A0A3P8QRW9_ASTCA